MAERSNAAVLKTVEVKASGGSNPSLSANKEWPARAGIFVSGREAGLPAEAEGNKNDSERSERPFRG
jgi:hypothetical protein